MIIDNDIFWNNFNFHDGRRRSRSASDGTAALVPVGTGILLLGGRGNRVENNRIFGNYLAGVARDRGHPAREEPAARGRSSATSVTGNAFGLNGTDTNGRDIVYDGNGSDNCFSATPASTSMFPADGSTFATARAAAPTRSASDVQNQMLALHRRGRAERLGQAPAPGASKGYQAAGGLQAVRRASSITLIAGVALLGAAPAHGRLGKPQKKKVELGDNFYAPTKLTVKRGTRRSPGVAWLRRGGRRPRRQALQGPQGRQEVPLRARVERTTPSSAS